MKNKLYGKNVVVQGITGQQGSFHTKAMLDYGTNIVAGTSPNLTESTVHGVPVYKSLADIPSKVPVDVSVIFVPAKYATGAILEAINAKVPYIVCITENIPQHDMLHIKQRLKGSGSVLIGPNSPGVLLPGVAKYGIIPAELTQPGSIAIVSRSGTLTYEAMAGLSARGKGQKYVIGIGGDPIKGSGFKDYLELFQNDPDVTSIVMIGEIGGKEELKTAEYIKNHITKPVYAYIAGQYAPLGVRLGHAGAILGSEQESAAHKTKVLTKAGAHTATSITNLVKMVE